MAITFVSESHNTGTSGTDVVVTAPTGIQDDDILLGFAQAGGGVAGSWSAIGGLTSLGEVATTAGRDLVTNVCWKRASSESGDYTFTYDTASVDRTASIIVLRGVDTTTAFDVTYVEATHHTSGQNLNLPTCDPITTVTDGAWVVLFHGSTHNEITAGGAPTNYALRVDEATGATNRQQFVATREITTASTETPGAWTHTQSGGPSSEYHVYTIALRPAASGGAVPAVINLLNRRRD